MQGLSNLHSHRHPAKGRELHVFPKQANFLVAGIQRGAGNAPEGVQPMLTQEHHFAPAVLSAGFSG